MPGASPGIEVRRLLRSPGSQWREVTLLDLEGVTVLLEEEPDPDRCDGGSRASASATTASRSKNSTSSSDRHTSSKPPPTSGASTRSTRVRSNDVTRTVPPACRSSRTPVVLAVARPEGRTGRKVLPRKVNAVVFVRVATWNRFHTAYVRPRYWSAA